MPETVSNEAYQPMTFDAIKIGLASLRRSDSGPMAKSRSLKRLTIELKA